MELLKRIDALATYLVTKRRGDLCTNFYLVRKNVKAEDFIEVWTILLLD